MLAADGTPSHYILSSQASSERKIHSVDDLQGPKYFFLLFLGSVNFLKWAELACSFCYSSLTQTEVIFSIMAKVEMAKNIHFINIYIFAFVKEIKVAKE